jgi:hypothetical protein
MSTSNAPNPSARAPQDATRRGLAGRLFPSPIDNTYRGHKLALWCFAAVVFMKTAISVNSIFNGRFVAGTADGIPLDSYPPAAVRTIISLFALVGLSQLTISLLCLVALVRYRSLVPFMFSLLLVERLSRKIIFQFMGEPRTSPINTVLLTLMLAGVALSCWPEKRVRTSE